MPTKEATKDPKKKDEEEEVDAPEIFPDATQLALAGVKHPDITAVEGKFDAYIELRTKLEKTRTAMNDAKEALKGEMQERKVPHYGKKVGKVRWLVALDPKTEVVVKRCKPDRE